MAIGNILIICMLIFYSIYFFNLFINKEAKNLQQTNIELDKLRKKSIKTLDEQKKFLNLKYPKKVKNKKTLRWWISLIGMLLLTIIIALCYNYLFSIFNININIWWAIIVVTFFPLLLNMFLSRFKLDNNDLLDLFKGGKEK